MPFGLRGAAGNNREFRGLGLARNVLRYYLTRSGPLATGPYEVGAFVRAREMGLKSLFLLTNHQQRSSIHLYEKLGFVHSGEIMDKYGHEYERADVAMKWVAE